MICQFCAMQKWPSSSSPAGEISSSLQTPVSCSMERVLERYMKSCRDLKASNNAGLLDTIGIGKLTQSINIKTLQSNLSVEELEQCSLRDLIHLEQQLYDRLKCIYKIAEELLLKQLGDFKEMVNAVQREKNAKSSIVKKLLDRIIGEQELGSRGGSEDHCLQVIPQIGSSIFVGLEERELACEDLLHGAKQPKITQDLNELPSFIEE